MVSDLPMSFTHLPFASLEWTTGAHPLEKKKVVDGHPVVMLEFAPGFEDPNWCERGHLIYALSGALELVLATRIERVTAGDGCVMPAGTRHRARNPGQSAVRLLVISTDAADAAAPLSAPAAPAGRARQ